MEFNAQITKQIKKYSGNIYALIEISLNTCRNTPDFMCDLKLFSKIQSHMVLYHISTMKQFNFSKPEEWPQWIKRFECFCQASGLAWKSEESQVNMLI